MTNGPAYIDTRPKLIPARVSIHHLQLRDLLQPAGVPDKVLFVNRLKIEQADFNTLKPPSTYCTLDFLPNCLTTSCGLLAAGGQHSELALRPLHTPSSGSSDADVERYPAPWLLRTPTGGSINNAISIQPDCYAQPALDVSAGSHPEASYLSRRRRERIQVIQPRVGASSTIWARDEPRSPQTASSSQSAQRYPTSSNAQRDWQLSDCADRDDTAAAYGFDPASTSPWRSATSRRGLASTLRSSLEAERRANASAELALPAQQQAAGPVKIMVSNNDQSIKSYKLRPPSGSPGAGGRIESGLPGLSKTSTLHFPTAINHSSLSPDRRTLVAVGDTPEVFIYHVRPNGDFDKVATYSASTDASFSTTWSPDGSKFAVASQDGIVSVWDVRSSYPLASLSTAQAGMAGGNGAARVAKFSPNGDMLAFTEHRNFFHIVDTVSFTNVQRLPAPILPSAPVGTAATGGSSLAPPSTLAPALDNSSGSEETDLLLPPSTAGGVGSGRTGLTGTGLLNSSTTGGGTSTNSHRMQILLNAAQAHREASSVLDRFRITSSVSPTYSTYESLLHGRIGPGATPASAAAAMLEEFEAGGGGGGASGAGSAVTMGSMLLGRRMLDDDDDVRVGGVGSRRRRGGAGPASEEGTTNVSGLCWDLSGEYVYVSTERCVARYAVLDPRQASYGAQLL